MNNTLIKSIGIGAGFPIELTTTEDGVAWKAEVGVVSLINQNLRAIINYQIGQRFRQEHFGTRIWECIEEPNIEATAFLVRRFILDGISSWEPRLKFLELKINRQSTMLNLKLRYKVINTQDVGELDFSYNPVNGNINI